VLPARSSVCALAAAALLLGGCAATGSDSETIAPTAGPFPPQFATDADIPVIEDIAYSTRDDQTQYLDACFPEDEVVGGELQAPRAAILLIHGGSWQRGDKATIPMRSTCQWFASLGYVAVSINYRFAPEWAFPAQLDDAQDAVRWLRDPDIVKRYNIDPERIGVFGASAGGNIGALVGTVGTGDWVTGTRVAAVVDLSGPAVLTVAIEAATQADPDFVQEQLAYLGCADLADCATAARASPGTYADVTDPPFFVAHSLEEFIPVSQSEDFVARLREVGAPVDFVTVEGTFHAMALLDDAMKERIRVFFGQALKEDPLDQAQPLPSPYTPVP
jgi:acetyl esterase